MLFFIQVPVEAARKETSKKDTCLNLRTISLHSYGAKPRRRRGAQQGAKKQRGARQGAKKTELRSKHPLVLSQRLKAKSAQWIPLPALRNDLILSIVVDRVSNGPKAHKISTKRLPRPAPNLDYPMLKGRRVRKTYQKVDYGKRGSRLPLIFSRIMRNY